MFLAPWLYHIICAVFFVFRSVRSLYGSTWLYISHERHCFVEVKNTHECVCVLCIQYANAFLVGCMGGLEEGCTLAVIVFFFFFSNTCCLVVVCRHQGYNCRNTIICSLQDSLRSFYLGLQFSASIHLIGGIICFAF